MSVLEAKDIAVRVGSKVLLHPASLQLHDGTLTAIVGPNGAGKSTLIKAILGLVAHTGQAMLDAKPLANLPAAARARQVAYLPQGQSHAWPLSVEAVVALGRYPHPEKYGDRNDQIVTEVLARMDLETRRDQSVLTLSGGEQMRVALARALAVQARFLLADEPLASLDPRYQFQIMDALAREATAGVGVVVVLHDLALAARYADRIVMLADGRIVTDGPPQDVLTAEALRNAFGVRSQSSTVARTDGPISVCLPTGPV